MRGGMPEMLLAASLLVITLPGAALGEVTPPPPPVIDMHVHSANTSAREQLSRMDALNIRFVWLSALAPDLPVWSEAIEEGRMLTGLTLPCPGGRAPFVPRPCWGGVTDFPDLTWLRGEIQAGRIRALGEMVPQLFGISPVDPRLDPYWALAEELDVPVALHMGPGPRAAAYESSPSPVKFPEFRMAANDPLLLEEVLLRHKRLRVLLMHAGWPFLDSTLALLYAHPNVYVDVGALQAPVVTPRAGYHRYLRTLVENGFADRIVFGSDFPNAVGPGIEAIREADFLTDQQKADILCRNGARFLRLPDATCQP